MEYEPAGSAEKPGRPLVGVLILTLVAFLLGLAAMAWVLAHWERGARFLGIVPAAQQQPAPAITPAITVQREPPPIPQTAPSDGQVPATDPELIRRVNVMEQRLAALDLQSRAAVGNAGRAEALLVAFAARRAHGRGVQLG